MSAEFVLRRCKKFHSALTGVPRGTLEWEEHGEQLLHRAAMFKRGFFHWRMEELLRLGLGQGMSASQGGAEIRTV
jgi:hypothetical protein